MAHPTLRNDFEIFIPFHKVNDLAKDHPDYHTVEGIASQEILDKDNEIIDLDGSWPLIKNWSDGFKKTTNESGQEESLGNLRVQHTTEIAGKLTDISLEKSADTPKTVYVKTYISNDKRWDEIKKGIFSGFSFGGRYVTRDQQPDGTVKYTAEPNELSICDNPCVDTARFSLVKSDGTVEMRKFAPRNTLNKSDVQAMVTEGIRDAFVKLAAEPGRGPLTSDEVENDVSKDDSKTKRKGGKDLHASDFAYVGDPNDISTWKLPIHDAAHVRNALARFNQTQSIPASEKPKVLARIKAKAKELGITVGDKVAKFLELDSNAAYGVINDYAETMAFAMSKAAGTDDFDSASVAAFAAMSMQVSYLAMAADDEESELQDAIVNDILRAAENADYGKATENPMSTEFQKALTNIADRCAGMKAAHTAHHAKMCKLHKDHMDAMHSEIDKVIKAVGAIPAEVGDEPGAVNPGSEIDTVRHEDGHELKVSKDDIQKMISDGITAGLTQIVEAVAGAKKTSGVSEDRDGERQPHAKATVNIEQPPTAGSKTNKEAADLDARTIRKLKRGDQDEVLKAMAAVVPVSEAEKQKAINALGGRLNIS